MATGGGDSDTEADDTVNKLKCAICLEQYRRPKLLPCFHTFCQSCLQNIAGTSPSLACPSCRSPVLLPPGGVKALQSNFYIEEDLKNAASSPQPRLCDVCTEDREATHTCIQCQQRFCLPCRTCHDGMRLCQGHTVVPLTPEDQDGCGKGGASPDKAGDQPQQVCSKHPDQRLVLHCKQCQADICLQCKLTQHDGHPAEDLVDIQAKARTDLQDMLQGVVQRRQQVNHLILALNDRCTRVNQQQAETEQELRSRADTLHQWVSNCLAEAAQNVQTSAKEVEQSLQNQVERLQNKDKALEAQEDLMLRVLRGTKGTNAVSLKAQLSSSCSDDADLKQIEKELTKDIPKFHVQHSTSSVCQLQLREFIGALQPVQPAPCLLQPDAASDGGRSADGKSSPKIQVNAVKAQPIKKLVYSTNARSSVVAICPISRSRLWVMYKKGTSVLMGLFDADGQMLTTVTNAQLCDGLIAVTADDVLSWRYKDGDRPIQMISPSGQLSSHDFGITIGHLVTCATNDAQYIRFAYKQNVHLVDFVATRGKLTYTVRDVVCRDAPGLGCPGHVSWNMEYCVFVIFGQVKIYAANDKLSKPLAEVCSYAPARKTAIDARFCQIDEQEQLLVLVENDRVHVVDHRHGGTFVRYLDTGSHSLDGARCMATNFHQYLWIGCDGGEVVMVRL